MSDTRPEPRRCYVILADQRDEEGYIPSLVVEGEPGHSPFTGNGKHARPWHWGRTYDEANALCAKFNAEDFGHTAVDVAIIVASSIAAGPVPTRCPVCLGPVTQVPEGRFGTGLFECDEAARQACDRFFRADELATA